MPRLEEQYSYTADLNLMCRDFCRPLHCNTLPELRQVPTPLTPMIWEGALATHPDRAYVAYILRGLHEGFEVGFQWDTPVFPATRNMHSTTLRPQVISEYIANKLIRGRIVGPFPSSWKVKVHVNRFDLILKDHNMGRYHLITDVSLPKGSSVNDGIDPALTSLS